MAHVIHSPRGETVAGPCGSDFLIVNEHEALEVYAGCGLGGGGGASSGAEGAEGAKGAADVDPLDASLAR